MSVCRHGGEYISDKPDRKGKHPAYIINNDTQFDTVSTWGATDGEECGAHNDNGKGL